MWIFTLSFRGEGPVSADGGGGVLEPVIWGSGSCRGSWGDLMTWVVVVCREVFDNLMVVLLSVRTRCMYLFLNFDCKV